MKKTARAKNRREADALVAARKRRDQMKAYDRHRRNKDAKRLRGNEKQTKSEKEKQTKSDDWLGSLEKEDDVDGKFHLMKIGGRRTKKRRKRVKRRKTRRKRRTRRKRSKGRKRKTRRR